MDRTRRLVNRILRPLGLELRRLARKEGVPQQKEAAAAYIENPEVGAANLSVKLARVAAGGPFEWPDIVALNHAVAHFVQGAKRIVELGGGTGCFAYAVCADPDVQLVCSECDCEASRWASQHRVRANIRYVDRPVSVADGPFDLVVSLEVIEHVADFASFVEQCRRLAPRAVLSTPNRLRSPHHQHAGPPLYKQHVREWSAGEFYWVLRSFYSDVRLYALRDVMATELVRVDVNSLLTPLVADCREPMPSERAAR